MHRRGPMKDFGGTAPNHCEARRSGTFLKVPDVVHQHLGVIHLGAFGLQIGAIDAAHIVAVEDGRHGFYFFERAAQAFNQSFLENARMEGCFVTVFLEDIPAPECEVFDLRKGHEVLDFGRIIVGSLTEPDRVQLRN